MCPGPEKHGQIIKQKRKGGGVTELIFYLAFILFSLIAHFVQFWKAAPHFTILSSITVPTVSENRQLLFKEANMGLFLQKTERRIVLKPYQSPCRIETLVFSSLITATQSQSVIILYVLEPLSCTRTYFSTVYAKNENILFSGRKRTLRPSFCCSISNNF